MTHAPAPTGLIIGLDHVQIEAPPGHLDEARAFYGHFLGLPELLRPEGIWHHEGLWFALPDGRQLHTGKVDEAFTPREKGHPCLRCRDLDALLSRAADFGVATEVDTMCAPVRRAFLQDPFGNRLEIVENAHPSVPLPV